MTSAFVLSGLCPLELRTIADCVLVTWAGLGGLTWSVWMGSAQAQGISGYFPTTRYPVRSCSVQMYAQMGC
jgi:hypothetical protein